MILFVRFPLNTNPFKIYWRNFMKCLLSASALMLLSFSTQATANFSIAHDKEQMVQNLDVISNSFYVEYAPADWKKKYSGWDLDEEIHKAKEEVYATNPLSVKDFQRIVHNFFKSTKDYHVGVQFHSTELACLPFRVKSADGKYFFTYIDASKLSSAVFPFSVGDELIAFDGKPIAEVIQEVKNEVSGESNGLTDYSLAEVYLTTRMGTLGHRVPNGPVLLTVKPKDKKTSSNFQLIWEYYPEQVMSKGGADFTKNAHSETHERHPILEALLRKQMTPYFFTALKGIEALKMEEDMSALASRQGCIPTLGKLWWKTEKTNSFHAYIYETQDRALVGYIRIPHYHGDDLEIQEFAEIIRLFQDRTEALVIDQINNPGGSCFYLYALASMLTDQPLYTPKHRIAISQAEVMEAISFTSLLKEIRSDAEAKEMFGESFAGTPMTFQMVQFMLNYFRFIVDEWNAGRTLTTPYYLYGIDHINPHPTVQYTKPILVLTNELDFSGGDFFPAILQDNKRATILGECTAGAGGFVTAHAYPNHFGIAEYYYTASIAERLDNNPIENLGVQPDIRYSVSEKDLQGNYQDYVRAIQKAVDKLLKKNH